MTVRQLLNVFYAHLVPEHADEEYKREIDQALNPRQLPVKEQSEDDKRQKARENAQALAALRAQVGELG
jgi:F0F1-type ATP synthase membrane subunit b/b'